MILRLRRPPALDHHNLPNAEPLGLYSPEFRRETVDLVRAGRFAEDLVRAFEPAGQSIGGRIVTDVNVMAERFSTLKAELLSRRRFTSPAEAKVARFSHIEDVVWFR